MYDIDRYYNKKIFVKFNTEEEFEQFRNEVCSYAKERDLIFNDAIYSKSYFYTASWTSGQQKRLNSIGFCHTANIEFIHELDEWYILSAKDLEVHSFNSDEILAFIGGY